MGEQQTWVRRHAAKIGLGAFVGWALVVLLSGAGVNLTGISWSFERTGQLGDSFGVIGAAMASVAAYFAFRTYQETKDENDILKQERDDANRRKSEPSFLNLLERRYDALNQATYLKHRGSDAITSFAANIRSAVNDYDVNHMQAYRDYLANTRNLPHLFRYTYHIIRYAERHFDGGAAEGRPVKKADISYEYVRLLRSQLSNDELLIIALNALTEDGEGAKPFIERYALLHNMDEADIAPFQLKQSFAEEAFGLPE